MFDLSDDEYVMLLPETLACPAWRAMSHGARNLYVMLKARYVRSERNNGKIVLPIRTAAAEMGSAREEIVRWLRELEHFGFIVKQWECEGYSPHWRLTELGYMKNRPTRDFMHWDGKPFVRQTRASRYRGNARSAVLEQAAHGAALNHS